MGIMTGEEGVVGRERVSVVAVVVVVDMSVLSCFGGDLVLGSLLGRSCLISLDLEGFERVKRKLLG